jgi:NADPH:quinone reductase-like Zn-dependent oxidoreductase
MRAVVHDRYGPPEVLRVEEVEPPVPAADEVLVRVRATTVTQTDCHIRRAQPFIWRFMVGFRRPRRRILGLELAGVVEAVGAEVTEFAVGDEVFGIQWINRPQGTHAELVCMPAGGALAAKPPGMSFEEAAAVCDGFIQGLTALSRGGVGAGTRLVVYGASGSCGTGAVQLARHLGAHVTAVTTAKNLDLVRSLGADEVVDYEREDFTKNGETYDVILDAVGKYSFLHSRRSLRPGGLYVATDGLRNLALLPLTRLRRNSRRIVFGSPSFSKKNVLRLKELIEAGEYRAVIDRTYPLEEVVEAARYVETWQKIGNVVLTLNGGPPR